MERYQEHSDGVSRNQVSLVDQNQLVSSGQKQHYITINKIIFANIFDIIHHHTSTTISIESISIQ